MDNNLFARTLLARQILDRIEGAAGKDELLGSEVRNLLRVAHDLFQQYRLERPLKTLELGNLNQIKTVRGGAIRVVLKRQSRNLEKSLAHKSGLKSPRKVSKC